VGFKTAFSLLETAIHFLSRTGAATSYYQLRNGCGRAPDGTELSQTDDPLGSNRAGRWLAKTETLDQDLTCTRIRGDIVYPRFPEHAGELRLQYLGKMNVLMPLYVRERWIKTRWRLGRGGRNVLRRDLRSTCVAGRAGGRLDGICPVNPDFGRHIAETLSSSLYARKTFTVFICGLRLLT
jgi:hypothetical protein